jgi:hypothetical protein
MHVLDNIITQFQLYCAYMHISEAQTHAHSPLLARFSSRLKMHTALSAILDLVFILLHEILFIIQFSSSSLPPPTPPPRAHASLFHLCAVRLPSIAVRLFVLALKRTLFAFSPLFVYHMDKCYI